MFQNKKENYSLNILLSPWYYQLQKMGKKWGNTHSSVIPQPVAVPHVNLRHLISPHCNQGKQTHTLQKEARAALLTRRMCEAPARRVSDSQERLHFIYRR